MKAAVIDAYGPASHFQVREMETPEIEPDQVLLQVWAAGVNPIDWKIRDGQMAFRYGEDFPKILGFDVSGVVAAVGSEARQFEVGDHVFGRSDVGDGGTYAEYAVLREATVALKPDRLSHVEAASLPLAGITALQGLRDCGQVKRGQNVLIVGASGGVGTLAVQVAKIMGAQVTGVCSGANVDLVKALGADRVIDYTSENALQTDTPYDVIYDTVGTQKVGDARQVLHGQGVYMTLVPMDDVDFFHLGQTERAGQGAYFVMCAASAPDLDVLAGWVDAGKLRAVIDSTYSLDHIAQAHERSETERARGKIVVTVRDI